MKDKLQKIRVDLGKIRSYEVIIGKDILKDMASFINQLKLGRDICIITDSKVARYYLKEFLNSFKVSGFIGVKKIIVPEGEKSKTLSKAGLILKWLCSLDRYQKKDILIVNLGGGMIGDLGGFIAGIYRRGTDYIQVPTSLVAQVDASVGGKVALNSPEAKNIIGLFWQPRQVLVDVGLLKTLDKRELKSGLAEVVKYGMIYDKRLFEFLERNFKDILNLNQESLQFIILRSLRIKADIVRRDERDKKDIRIMLNFGHTLGHAIESVSKYNYHHGEAIAVGMICASEIALYLKLFKKESLRRLENLINNIGLPSKIKGCAITQILNSMRRDKKFRGQRNRFILPLEIGEVVVREGIPEDIIKKILKKRLAS